MKTKSFEPMVIRRAKNGVIVDSERKPNDMYDESNCYVFTTLDELFEHLATSIELEVK